MIFTAGKAEASATKTKIDDEKRKKCKKLKKIYMDIDRFLTITLAYKKAKDLHLI